MDTGSILFLETLLQYYMPRLDVSALDEQQFISKVAHLLKIRSMERNDKVAAAIQKIFSNE